MPDDQDPIPDTTPPPTPYEWVGGLPAHNRMTRLFYERHVPADPLIGPLFADMPPDHPERVGPGWARSSAVRSSTANGTAHTHGCSPSISANLATILDRLVGGAMPCDGRWPADRVETFRRWVDSAMPE